MAFLLQRPGCGRELLPFEPSARRRLWRLVRSVPRGRAAPDERFRWRGRC